MGRFGVFGHRQEQSAPCTPYVYPQADCGIQGAACQAWDKGVVVAYDGVTRPGYDALISSFQFNQNNLQQAYETAAQKGVPVVAVIGNWENNPRRLMENILPFVQQSSDAVYVYIDKDKATGEAARVAAVCNANRNNVVSAVFALRTGADGKPVPELPTYNLLGGDPSNIASFTRAVQDCQRRMQAQSPPEKPAVVPTPPRPVEPKNQMPSAMVPNQQAPKLPEAPGPRAVDARDKELEQLRQELFELKQQLNSMRPSGRPGPVGSQPAEPSQSELARLRNQAFLQNRENARLREELDGASRAQSASGSLPPAGGIVRTPGNSDSQPRNETQPTASPANDKDPDLLPTFLRGAAAGLGLKLVWDWWRRKPADGLGAPEVSSPLAKKLADDIRARGADYHDTQPYVAYKTNHPDGVVDTYVVQRGEEEALELSESEFKKRFAVTDNTDIKPDRPFQCRRIEPIAALRMPAKDQAATAEHPSGDYAFLRDGKVFKSSAQSFEQAHAEVFVDANGKKVWRMTQNADGLWDVIDIKTGQTAGLKSDAEFNKEYSRVSQSPTGTAGADGNKGPGGTANKASVGTAGGEVLEDQGDTTRRDGNRVPGDPAARTGDPPSIKKGGDLPPTAASSGAPKPQLEYGKWMKVTGTIADGALIIQQVNPGENNAVITPEIKGHPREDLDPSSLNEFKHDGKTYYYEPGNLTVYQKNEQGELERLDPFKIRVAAIGTRAYEKFASGSAESGSTDSAPKKEAAAPSPPKSRPEKIPSNAATQPAPTDVPPPEAPKQTVEEGQNNKPHMVTTNAGTFALVKDGATPIIALMQPGATELPAPKIDLFPVPFEADKFGKVGGGIPGIEGAVFANNGIVYCRKVDGQLYKIDGYYAATDANKDIVAELQKKAAPTSTADSDASKMVGKEPSTAKATMPKTNIEPPGRVKLPSVTIVGSGAEAQATTVKAGTTGGSTVAQGDNKTDSKTGASGSTEGGNGHDGKQTAKGKGEIDAKSGGGTAGKLIPPLAVLGALGSWWLKE